MADSDMPATHITLFTLQRPSLCRWVDHSEGCWQKKSFLYLTYRLLAVPHCRKDQKHGSKHRVIFVLWTITRKRSYLINPNIHLNLCTNEKSRLASCSLGTAVRLLNHVEREAASWFITAILHAPTRPCMERLLGNRTAGQSTSCYITTAVV
jgi:hypothetical protein